MKSVWSRIRLALLSLGATWFAPALAAAQEFEKFQGKPAEQIPAGPFVAGAYGFIWAAVLLYVVSLARKLGRTRAEIDDLRRRLDGRG